LTDGKHGILFIKLLLVISGLFIFASQITKQHKHNKRKRNKVKEQKLMACWWEYKNIKNFRLSKLMCYNIFESQRVGEGSNGSIA